MYFRLNPECYFVCGEKLGAIYDLVDNKVYSLNQRETEILKQCEKNSSVNTEEDFLKELKQLRMGNFYTDKIYVQKLRIGSMFQDPFSEPLQIQRAFIEINNSCNRNCWYCGFQGVKRSLGCVGCNKWTEIGEPLSIERWKELMNQLRDLSCANIYIKGGDLTLIWKKTMHILDHANSIFRKVYISLHHQSLSDGILNELKGRAKVIVQVDKLCDIQPGSDCSYLLTKKPNEWKNVSNLISKNVKVDFAITDINFLPKDLPIMSQKKISTKLRDFFHNVKYHPCLGGTITICNNGDVLPCPMMRNNIVGNLKNKELYTILDKKDDGLLKFWNLNLDKIGKCKSCQFRYACSDCRSLEGCLTRGLDSKSLCSYDPVEGVWL